MKKIVVYLMVGIIAFTSTDFSVLAAGEERVAAYGGGDMTEEIPEDEMDILVPPPGARHDINVEYHTQEEIREYVRTHPASLNDPISFAVQPVLDGEWYYPGRLSNETMTSALNMTNQLRYIAGLSEVELDEEYINLAQAGITLCYGLQGLAHYDVYQPQHVSRELYNKATEGIANCALGHASWVRSINDTMVFGWMSLDYVYKTGEVGMMHRRRILNPSLQKVGFGAVFDDRPLSAGTYASMHITDQSNTWTNAYGVAWPAQNMPIEYYDNDAYWSFATGIRYYENWDELTITKVNTGRVWHLIGPDANREDGTVRIDNRENIPQSLCYMWKMNGVTVNKGDVFRVSIKSQLFGDLEYDINFFSLYDDSPITTPIPDPEPDPAPYFGWQRVYNKAYWYEKGIKQGTYTDPKGVLGDRQVRGREIYDPESNAWYWLDSCYEGAKAEAKEVWMPYVFQGEADFSEEEINRVASLCGELAPQVKNAIKAGRGKWVRYDENGRMITGWLRLEGYQIYSMDVAEVEKETDEIMVAPIKRPACRGPQIYYYEPITGMMAKGWVTIGGQEYYFDPTSGIYDPIRTRDGH